MLAPHRQAPNHAREQRERIWAKVEKALGGRIICGRCKATSQTYGDVCTANVGDGNCPGETAIAAAELQAKKELGLA